jgi:hypothetical protein
MKRFKWTVAAIAGGLLALLGGCGKGLDDPVDPDQARAVLQTALDVWKQGESFGTLEKRNPPMYFNEPEWKAGKKLVAFEVGKVDLLGRQGRCSVKLSLRDKDGNETERKTNYLIDTTPQVVITREALGS